MEEIKIDCAHQSPEEQALAKEQALLIFKLNHTMPMTEEYNNILHLIFPNIGENSRIMSPSSAVRIHHVKIGKRIIIMNRCLMMAARDNTIVAGNPARLIRHISPSEQPD